jgi:hypothetical protein
MAGRQSAAEPVATIQPDPNRAVPPCVGKVLGLVHIARSGHV